MEAPQEKPLEKMRKTIEAEKPEKKFDREIKRIAIDENHDLVAFGDTDYAPQTQDDNAGKLQREEIELAVVNKKDGEKILNFSFAAKP